MKGKICIGVLCVIIVLVFAGMCHLMKDINPPPLKPDELQRAERPAVSGDLKIENVVFNDASLRAPDDAQFGLEKINTDNLQYSTYGPRPDPTIVTENFDIWKYTPRKVVPLIWPKTTPIVIGGRSTFTTRIINGTKDINENTTLSAILTSPVPVKRSIEDLTDDEYDEIPGSIIVKIKDDSGHFNIEIKLGPTDIFKRKRYRENKGQPQKKSKFSISLQNKSYDQFKQNEIGNNTIVSIIANDSAIVDEYNDNFKDENKIKNNLVKAHQKENLTDNINLNTIVVQNSTHNNTDYDNILFMKVDPQLNITTEMPIYKDIYTLNVLFDNTTQYIKHSDAEQNYTNNNDLFEDVKKLTNVSEAYESKVFNYITTNITEWKNSLNSSTEHSTTEKQFSIIEVLTTITTTTELLLNSTSNEESLKTVSEISTVENENYTTPLQELNIENDNLIQFENLPVSSNNDSTKNNDIFNMTENINTTNLVEKIRDESHNNESYFM